MLLGLVIAVLVVLADLVSKYFVLHHFLGVNPYVYINDYFNVVKAWNTGVSFSMLNDYGNLGVWLLSGLAVAIVIALFFWLKSENNKLIQASLGMIMGGAIGNVIDRLRFGAVFDFLDVHIADSHWPAFNVADSFICIGAGLIVIQALFGYFEKKGE